MANDLHGYQLSKTDIEKTCLAPLCSIPHEAFHVLSYKESVSRSSLFQTSCFPILSYKLVDGFLCLPPFLKNARLFHAIKQVG